MSRVQRNRMTAAEFRALKAKPKGANDLEAAFGEHLRMLHRDGIITEPKYHRVHDPKSLHLPLLPPCGPRKRTLKLTPDWTFRIHRRFEVERRIGHFIAQGRLVAIDCKGWQREDAWLKIRLAACLYPDIAFFIVRRVRSGWKWERVRGGELGVEVDW